MAERKIAKSQRSNVRKQVEQLAFSLNQAREYFRSAESSGPATRALMAYYGLIALANAEVLWSGDGRCSFDARHRRFNSHGFSLVHSESLVDFGARPTTDETGITGLFGLWRKLALHLPHYAKQTSRYPEGGLRITFGPTSSVTALKDLEYPQTPLSLLDCLQHIPAMRGALDAYDERTKLCRGVIEQHSNLHPDGSTQSLTRTFMLHHLTDEAFHDVGSKFRIASRAVPEFRVETIGTGLAIVWNADLETPGYYAQFSMPETFAESKEEILFVGSGEHLNEFGYYYVALYIAGMITRYYPHLWIKETRSNSKGSTLIDELVDNALSRVPILTASALEQRIYLYE
ncbi:YaaC family protein [Rhizobium leguminosarum]